MMAYWNSWPTRTDPGQPSRHERSVVSNAPLSDGFLATPLIKAANTVPIPMPAPASPTVAAPAPMHFPAMTMAAVVLSATMPRVWVALRSARAFAGVSRGRVLECG